MRLRQHGQRTSLPVGRTCKRTVPLRIPAGRSHIPAARTNGTKGLWAWGSSGFRTNENREDEPPGPFILSKVHSSRMNQKGSINFRHTFYKLQLDGIICSFMCKLLLFFTFYFSATRKLKKTEPAIKKIQLFSIDFYFNHFSFNPESRVSQCVHILNQESMSIEYILKLSFAERNEDGLNLNRKSSDVFDGTAKPDGLVHRKRRDQRDYSLVHRLMGFSAQRLTVCRAHRNALRRHCEKHGRLPRKVSRRFELWSTSAAGSVQASSEHHDVNFFQSVSHAFQCSFLHWLPANRSKMDNEDASPSDTVIIPLRVRRED